MNYSFEKRDIEAISNILGIKPEINGNDYSWITNPSDNIFKCYIDFFTHVSPNNNNVLQIQTMIGHYELCNIKCWSKLYYNEVGFFSVTDKILSTIVVSSDGVYFYANIDKDIIETDITNVAIPLQSAYSQMNTFNNLLDS